MMLAVIKTGGKQYVVSPKQELVIEKLKGKEGDAVEFSEVLLVGDKKGKDVEMGTPYLKGKKITGKIISQQKGDKVTVVKYKAKVRYKKTTGHRQHETKVRIDDIV